ncbi:MAG: ATP-binding domain-containing protein, partial [Oscillospiraceae bacterium]|nr:ATP-binding domain-containing protein [Oscillospiraceae bacterium]
NRGRKGKELWTDSGDGEKVHVHLAENEQDEAVYISREIYKHTEAGIPLSAHAVLYRTNAQSSTVETYFARAGVPYKVVGALRFYDRAEIKDVMSYLSIIANPADNLRLKRIINKPARKIGDTTIERIDRIAAERGVPMLAILRDCEQYADLSRAAAPLRSFYSLYERLLECYHSEALGDFVDKLLDLTGYRAMLVAMGKEAESKLENINEFVSTVRLYEQQNPEGDLAAFLEEIALVSNLDNFDEAADRVSLMTIHSAKGLEFDYVYLIGMEDGIFPLDRARHSEADMEEERRLAYVGMTRAKKELHMTRAQMRMLYGMTRRNPPSRFLQEIDGEYTVETGEQQKPRSYLQGDYSRAQSAAAAGSFGRPYSGSSYGGGYGASASAKDSASYGSKPAAAAPKPRVKPNETAFHEGDSVQHRMFGKGRVISATPIGGDVLLEIEFETCGRKKAMANYAPMTKLED